MFSLLRHALTSEVDAERLFRLPTDGAACANDASAFPSAVATAAVRSSLPPVLAVA